MTSLLHDFYSFANMKWENCFQMTITVSPRSENYLENILNEKPDTKYDKLNNMFWKILVNLYIEMTVFLRFVFFNEH